MLILNSMQSTWEKNEAKLLSYCLAAARMLIAENWESAFIPSKTDQLQTIHHILLMKKLSAICKFHASQMIALYVFKSIWQQFLFSRNTCYLQINVHVQILELI